jgi:hypothetical protein
MNRLQHGICIERNRLGFVPGSQTGMPKFKLYIETVLRNLMREKTLLLVRIIGLCFILYAVMVVFLSIHNHRTTKNINGDNHSSLNQGGAEFPLTLSLFLYSDQP